MSKERGPIYDNSAMQVVALACLIIVAAVLVTGAATYFTTSAAVVDKLKSRDLVYIVETIATKIDNRVERGRETATILATDPVVREWVLGGEQDERLGNYTKIKLDQIAKRYDYGNAFLASALTHNYWAEDYKLLWKLTPGEDLSQWFYDKLAAKQQFDVVINYDAGRAETFMFVNVMIGDTDKPLGFTGVGIDLQKIEQEFKKYKFGVNGVLWLIDNQGRIYLSDDLSYRGKSIQEFLPAAVVAEVLDDVSNNETQILEYKNAQGELIDLAYQPSRSTDWKLIFQLPRSESLGILDRVGINTVISGVVILLLLIFVFYLVSRKIADPLKHSLQLTQEMKKQVAERTYELEEKNREIIDSIEYGQVLQAAMLVAPHELDKIFTDYFVIWQPRDLVGGDFYWARRLDNQRAFVALVDCTGHGVPGAFMTMLVNAVLNDLADQDYRDPGKLLTQLHRRVRAALHRNYQTAITDDGLDIALCYKDGSKLSFAGAKVSLYIKRADTVQVLAGDKSSIGYRNSAEILEFTTTEWNVQEADQFYLTSDGYIDQNGGAKNYSFGKKRFIATILAQNTTAMDQQKAVFMKCLQDYRGDYPQRDDITLVGFKLSERGQHGDEEHR